MRVWIDKYKKYWPATFFIGGFLFDIITLDRIDSWLTIIQQLCYLILLTAILVQLLLEKDRPPKEATSKIGRKWLDFRIDIMHFFFGSLLSSYTLFFFKSSSLIVSAVFMFIMAGILVANETKRVQSLNVSFKFGLLALCVFCYLAYLVPVLSGKMGAAVYTITICLGLLPFFTLARKLKSKLANPQDASRMMVRPALYVAVALLVLYFLHLVPPVPLSLNYIGVFHDVKRNGDQYMLSHENPWWRFWQEGDQTFEAEPGDKIYVFFRMFSPERFSDQVRMSWFYKDPKQGWIKADSVPIRVVGGRNEGFRGYGFKSNFMPGKWRVAIETVDELEIGRISLFVEIIPENTVRNWQITVQ